MTSGERDSRSSPVRRGFLSSKELYEAVTSLMYLEITVVLSPTSNPAILSLMPGATGQNFNFCRNVKASEANIDQINNQKYLLALTSSVLAYFCCNKQICTLSSFDYNDQNSFRFSYDLNLVLKQFWKGEGPGRRSQMTSACKSSIKLGCDLRRRTLDTTFYVLYNTLAGSADSFMQKFCSYSVWSFV